MVHRPREVPWFLQYPGIKIGDPLHISFPFITRQTFLVFPSFCDFMLFSMAVQKALPE